VDIKNRENIERVCRRSRLFRALRLPLEFSLEVSRAKALVRFPGCKAAWEAARLKMYLVSRQDV
jgi:hypothetical protein